MKMLLDETVYELPSDLVTAWIHMTPEFRDKLQELLRGYMKNQNVNPRSDVTKFASAFVGNNKAAYYQILFDAMMDCKATMGDGFEDYATKMTGDELHNYAEENNIVVHVPDRP